MKKTGRYHNDYSPRYTEAFDIYEKAKNHVKAQKKKERLHGNRSCDDNSVSDKVPQIRNLSKEQKTKDCGENNL